MKGLDGLGWETAWEDLPRPTFATPDREEGMKLNGMVWLIATGDRGFGDTIFLCPDPVPRARARLAGRGPARVPWLLARTPRRASLEQGEMPLALSQHLHDGG